MHLTIDSRGHGIARSLTEITYEKEGSGFDANTAVNRSLGNCQLRLNAN
jgi:hypothetical protein